MKKLLCLSLVLAAFTLSAVPVFAASSVVYDALPSVTPDTSYPSQPFQAQQVYEFGDLIHLGGTNRILNNVTVTFSDYAPFSTYSSDVSYNTNSTYWTHPITLNIYNVTPGTPNTVGSLLGTVTQTINIPWRPVADESCPVVYGERQWEDHFGICRSGYAFNATFDLNSLNVTLPDAIIVTVAFNTQSYGTNPIGTNGPYNSLNVSVPDNQLVSVGTDDPNSVFLNSTYSGAFANGSLAGLGLKEDTGWAPNGTVALQVTANAPIVPDSQQADIYHVYNCNSDQVSNDPYQGHVSLITPDGKNDLMLQGVIQGLLSNTKYTVWVRDLVGYHGDSINSYNPLGYFALTSFTTNKKGAGNFSYKINKTDLPAGTYSIQVALNTNTHPSLSTDYGCTTAATTKNFLKVYVGQ